MALVAWVVAASPSVALAQGDPSAWVGTWVALGRGIDLALGVEVTIEGGRLEAAVNQEGNMPGYPATGALLDAERLELVVALEDEPPVGRIVLRRDPDGLALHVVEGELEGRRLGRLTLRRRGCVWLTARSDVLDLAHAGEGRSVQEMRRYLDHAEATEDGLRSGARTDVLTDSRQCECVLPRMDELRGPTSATRRRIEALARAAGTGSLCDAAPPPAVASEAPQVPQPDADCDRVVVEDTDGATTLRDAARSSSASRGTVPNGTRLEVVERRGGWARVRGAAEGWVHQGNLRCAPSR